MAKGGSCYGLKLKLIREEYLNATNNGNFRENQENSKAHQDEVFTRLFRYMLRPDIYYVAYKNLYANRGAATKGVNDDTADGFGEEKINKIIGSLASDQYIPFLDRLYAYEKLSRPRDNRRL